MSAMQRVKDALASALTKLREDIEASHAAGKIPADYSLGFTNAAIFFDHRINMRPGDPKFYDRTTSIGALPKPMTLKDGRFKDVQGGDEIFEQLRDEVILAARNFLSAGVSGEPSATVENLDKAIKTMDKFIDDVTECQEAVKVEAASSQDAGTEGQEGSTPSTASTKGNLHAV